MGHAKCSGGTDDVTVGITLKQCGLKMSWYDPGLVAVRALIAWQVTMRDRALNKSG
jgi:hypothetical protein